MGCMAQVSTAPVSLLSTDAASDEPVPEASRVCAIGCELPVLT